MHELPFKYKVDILRILPSHPTPPCTSKDTWKHSQHLDWFKLRLPDAYPKTEKYRKTFTGSAEFSISQDNAINSFMLFLEFLTTHQVKI
jgi:hypothetical protein